MREDGGASRGQGDAAVSRLLELALALCGNFGWTRRAGGQELEWGGGRPWISIAEGAWTGRDRAGESSPGHSEATQERNFFQRKLPFVAPKSVVIGGWEARTSEARPRIL